MDAKEVQEARDRLKQKFSTGANRVGGKGTVRRKKKATHKASGTDDKKLQATLKRLGVQSIPGIEEVNLIKDDNTMIQFREPKLQASLQSNTFVVTGTAETKPVAEMSFQEQLAANPALLQQLLASQMAQGGRMPGMPGAGDDDDDMPELEQEGFEEAAK